MEDVKKFQDVYRRSVDGHNCQLSDTKQEGRIFGNVAQPFVVAKIFKGLASIVQLRRGAQAAELAVSLEEAAAAAQEGETLVKTGQVARTAAAGEQLGETFAAAQRGRNIAGAGVMSEEVAAEALQAEEAARRAATGAAKTRQRASKGGLGATTTIPTKAQDILVNPEAFRGASVDTALVEIEKQVPADWIKSNINKGEGIKWVHPSHNGESIMLEFGNNASKDVTGLHKGSYIRVTRHGTVTRVPLEGNPALNLNVE